MFRGSIKTDVAADENEDDEFSVGGVITQSSMSDNSSMNSSVLFPTEDHSLIDSISVFLGFFLVLIVTLSICLYLTVGQIDTTSARFYRPAINYY